MKFIKENMYIFVSAVVLCFIIAVFVNAVHEGYSVLVTQSRIDDSYRIHK